MTRRTFALTSLIASLRPLAAKPKPPASSPEAALSELVDGNQRFVKGHLRHPHDSTSWAKRTAEVQHPHTVVLCCSDSRVSPELVFDQGLGDLFVVRVAGNVANEDEIASIEYATAHLHVPLVLVLGHTQCGAVTAVVDGDDLPPEIHHLTVHIEEALTITRGRLPQLRGSELIEATVIANVRESVKDMLQGGAILKSAVAEGHVRVEGAVYDLHTGRVTWLDPLH